jgi:hypothetical protein
MARLGNILYEPSKKCRPSRLKQFSDGYIQGPRYSDQIPQRGIPPGCLDTAEVGTMDAGFFRQAFLR